MRKMPFCVVVKLGICMNGAKVSTLNMKCSDRLVLLKGVQHQCTAASARSALKWAHCRAKGTYFMHSIAWTSHRSCL